MGSHTLPRDPDARPSLGCGRAPAAPEKTRLRIIREGLPQGA